MYNAFAQFQAMMEWVLPDIPDAHPYIDEIIVGSSVETVEVLIKNHGKKCGRY